MKKPRPHVLICSLTFLASFATMVGADDRAEPLVTFDSMSCSGASMYSPYFDWCGYPDYTLKVFADGTVEIYAEKPRQSSDVWPSEFRGNATSANIGLRKSRITESTVNELVSDMSALDLADIIDQRVILGTGEPFAFYDRTGSPGSVVIFTLKAKLPSGTQQLHFGLSTLKNKCLSEVMDFVRKLNLVTNSRQWVCRKDIQSCLPPAPIENKSFK